LRLFHLAFLTAFTLGAVFVTPVPAAFAAEKPDSVPQVAEALLRGDLKDAFETTMALAYANDIEAQHNLSLFYWHGVGSSQKFDEAVSWSTMAAIRGHKKAMTARKIMVKAIDARAEKASMESVRKCLEYDAKWGDNSALLPLSTSYLKEFAPPDDVKAYVWSSLAVSMGKIEARRQRDLIMANMQQPDIVRGQKLANEWLEEWRKNPKKPSDPCDLIKTPAKR
jgi:TPR repeat protein